MLILAPEFIPHAIVLLPWVGMNVLLVRTIQIMAHAALFEDRSSSLFGFKKFKWTILHTRDMIVWYMRSQTIHVTSLWVGRIAKITTTQSSMCKQHTSQSYSVPAYSLLFSAVDYGTIVDSG